MSPPVSMLEERKSFGRYHPIAMLGRGGMARVFLTVAPGPAGVQKLLVVKELHPELRDRPDLQAMFLNEARLAARLNHTNVVQTYEVGEDRGRHFLVLEYLEGQSLDRILKRMRATVPLAAQLRIFCDVLAGLHYAHELVDYDGTPLGVVHRDVSPHNVFLTYDGLVKLVDFGIAKVVDVDGGTKAGLFKGKAKYTSPEQAVGGHVDRRSDIFSVGIMLWEALCGRRLWGEKTEIQVLVALSQGDWLGPSDVVPTVLPELDAICRKAMARDPDDRYATAAAMRDDLERALEELPRGATLRQLGEMVGEKFAVERARLRTQVDEQIRLMANLPEMSRVPALPTLGEDASESERPHVGYTPPGTAKEAIRTSAPPVRSSSRLGLVAITMGVLSAAATFVVVRGSGPTSSPAAASPAAVSPAAVSPAAVSPAGTSSSWAGTTATPHTTAHTTANTTATPTPHTTSTPPPNTTPPPTASATTDSPTAPHVGREEKATDDMARTPSRTVPSSPVSTKSTSRGRGGSRTAPSMTEIDGTRPTKPRLQIDEQDPYAK